MTLFLLLLLCDNTLNHYLPAQSGTMHNEAEHQIKKKKTYSSHPLINW